MSQSYDAVVAGYICLDVIPGFTADDRDRLDPMLLPGRMKEVGPVTCATGGAVSNTGLALTRLGLKTRLMGKVGDDFFGQVIKQIVDVHSPHMANGIVVDKTANSSYTIILSLPGVDRMFLHFPGANDTFSAGDVRYDLLSTTRLFHLGYPPLMKLMFENDGEQLVEIFRRAKKRGVTTSLDMAFPEPSSAAGRADWETILRAVLPHVDIFLPSIEEILFLFRRQTYAELTQVAGETGLLSLITPPLLSALSRELLELGAKIVVLKLGHRGLYLRTASRPAIESLGRACPSDPAGWADKELWTPCFKANAVGTTGSGDATIAGFLGALLRDLAPETAVTAAVAVGACNVEAADALSGIRRWGETLRRIAAGWPRHKLTLDAPGWRFDAAHRLWVSDREAAF